MTHQQVKELREAAQKVLDVAVDFHYVDATLGNAIHRLRTALAAASEQPATEGQVQILMPNGAFTEQVRNRVLKPSPCGVAGHFEFQNNGSSCIMCQLERRLVDEALMAAQPATPGKERERHWKEAMEVVVNARMPWLFKGDTIGLCSDYQRTIRAIPMPENWAAESRQPASAIPGRALPSNHNDEWLAHVITRWLLDVRDRHYEANEQTAMGIIDDVRKHDARDQPGAAQGEVGG